MSLTDEPEEILDLVDANDQVVGRVCREEVEGRGLALEGNVRAVDCFIVNNEGAIWVPRRASHKKVAPNGLDFSVGEHVKSGETYRQALVRGFKEEAGLIVDEGELLEIGTLNLRDFNLIPYFDALFVYKSDTAPDYNKTDFVSYEWLMPDEFMKRLKGGVPAKRNIVHALELYLTKKG